MLSPVRSSSPIQRNPPFHAPERGLQWRSTTFSPPMRSGIYLRCIYPAYLSRQGSGRRTLQIRLIWMKSPCDHRVSVWLLYYYYESFVFISSPGTVRGSGMVDCRLLSEQCWWRTVNICNFSPLATTYCYAGLSIGKRLFLGRFHA